MHSLPVIVLTGNVTAENTIGSLTKAHSWPLTKPYNSLELKPSFVEPSRSKACGSKPNMSSKPSMPTRTISYAGQINHRRHFARRSRANHVGGTARQSACSGYTKREGARFPSPLGDAGTQRFCSIQEEEERHHRGLAQGGSPVLISSKTIELVGMTDQNRNSFRSGVVPGFMDHPRWCLFQRDHPATFQTPNRPRGRPSFIQPHQNALILDSAGDGIFGLDVHGCATFVNATAARMLGWSAAELIGNALAPLVCDVGQSLRWPPGSRGASRPQSVTAPYTAWENVHTFARKRRLAVSGSMRHQPIHPNRNTSSGAVVVFKTSPYESSWRTCIQAQLSISHIWHQVGGPLKQSTNLLPVTGEMGPWDMALFWTRSATGDTLTCQGTWKRTSSRWDDSSPSAATVHFLLAWIFRD